VEDRLVLHFEKDLTTLKYRPPVLRAMNVGARIGLFVLGAFLFLGGIGGMFLNPSAGGALLFFGILLVAIAWVSKRTRVAPPAPVVVYQQVPMVIQATAAPASQTYVREREITREVVKSRCPNCGSLNLETDRVCGACGAPIR